MKNRILTIILAAALLLTLAVPVFADENDSVPESEDTLSGEESEDVTSQEDETDFEDGSLPDDSTSDPDYDVSSEDTAPSDDLPAETGDNMLIATNKTAEYGTFTTTDAIPAQYDAAQPFNEGLAAVREGSKWGYIDESGATVIDFKYDRAYTFYEGYAVVEEVTTQWEDGTYVAKIGFIDKSGTETWLETPEIDGEYIYDYYDSETELITVSEPEEHRFSCGYINIDSRLYDNSGNIVTFPGLANVAGYSENVTYVVASQVTESVVILFVSGFDFSSCYYDLTSDTVKTVTYTGSLENPFVELYPYNQGIAPVCVWYSDGSEGMKAHLFGFVDESCEWITEPLYLDMSVDDMEGEHIVFGSSGTAMVQNSNGKWGGIDKTGATVIPFEYDAIMPYSFGLASFSKDGYYGYMDTSGSEVITARYYKATSFSDSGYAVVNDGSETYLIDNKGERISSGWSPNYSAYFVEFENYGTVGTYAPTEYVVFEENGLYGYKRMEYTPALPSQDDMSNWAYDEIPDAIDDDLVPPELQNSYTDDTTRIDFCYLAINLIVTTTGKSIDSIVFTAVGMSLTDYQHTYPLTDTTDETVIAAYALGIVTGYKNDSTGTYSFEPYNTITRQEAAVMLARTANYLGLTAAVSTTSFNDASSIGGWASESVAFVAGLVSESGLAVMGGVGNNTFDPTGSYTRQQAIATFYRLSNVN